MTVMTVPPSRGARLLGYGGLVPFVGLAAATWMLDDTRRAESVLALLAYGATILSFVGAIHWGLAMRDPTNPPAAMLAWGVVPSLAAWAALLWGGSGGLCLLAAGLCTCWIVDRSVYPRFGLKGWLGMRLALTAVASLSCLAAALRVLQ